MLLGSDGPGGIEFDDAKLAREVGVVGLALILYEGGLQTSWRRLREVAVPAALLSTVGVVVSAVLTGARRVHALRPLVARVRAARRRRLLDRRRCRLRDAPVHAHPPPPRAHARGRVGRQRPDGDRAHARPDRLDRAARRLWSRRPAPARRPAARSRPRRRGRARRGRVMGLRPPAALDRRVRAGGVARGGRARVRRRRRDRRQRLPLGLSGRPRGRQHAVPLPPPPRLLPRGARVRRSGRALHRPRPARVPFGPAGRGDRGAGARACS